MTDGLWAAAQPLVLASRSASRRRLLAGCGVAVEAAPADLDERVIEAQMAARGGPPPAIARTLAAAKALAVSDAMRGRVVLGADQVLAFEDRCFAKAVSLAEAKARLALLAGRTHRLLSAAAVARDGVLTFECLETAQLTMRALTGAQIDSYLRIAGEEVLASVGAYRIEGVGRLLFECVEGEQATIIGLPLGRLLAHFRAAGLTRL